MHWVSSGSIGPSISYQLVLGWMLRFVILEDCLLDNDALFSFLFSVVVDPSNLADGLHYYEVYGIDCKAPWRGPLFRIPITITKPKAVVNRPPLVSFSKMSFLPGYFVIELVPTYILCTLYTLKILSCYDCSMS